MGNEHVQDPVKPYLAMYDFRGKQEYIYRTNKMREITGASELMACLSGDFLEANPEGAKAGEVDGRGFPVLRIRNDWRKKAAAPDGSGREVFQAKKDEEIEDVLRVLEEDPDLDGVVIFEGGGNLCVLYRDRQTYETANASFSRMVLDEGYNLGLLAAGVEWTNDADDEDAVEEGKGDGGGSNSEQGSSDVCSAFASNVKSVHARLDEKKRLQPARLFRNVLPFTQVDRSTSQPITVIDGRWTKDGKWEKVPLSEESARKREGYRIHIGDKDEESGGKWLDDMSTLPGTESLLAAVYVDGNSMGVKLEESGTRLSSMREFSVGTNDTFVERTIDAMKAAVKGLSAEAWWPGDWEQFKEDNTDEEGKFDDPARSYRTIVDHGDEITFICNAHAVPAVIRAYFDALEDAEREALACGKEERYTACMGIAVFHSHAPFADVYSLVEECCETGKKINRKRIGQRAIELNDGNIEGANDKLEQAGAECDSSYVDFHYVRSGITGDLEAIRGEQEAGLILRPYRIRPYGAVLAASSGADARMAAEDTPYGLFAKAGNCLYRSVSKSGGLSRADVKNLGASILKGDSWFMLEWARVESKDAGLCRELKALANNPVWAERGYGGRQEQEVLKRLVFDASSFFDIWFAHGESDFSDVGKGTGARESADKDDSELREEV